MPLRRLPAIAAAALQQVEQEVPQRGVDPLSFAQGGDQLACRSVRRRHRDWRADPLSGLAEGVGWRVHAVLPAPRRDGDGALEAR